jgi:hypothetical protein
VASSCAALLSEQTIIPTDKKLTVLASSCAAAAPPLAPLAALLRRPAASFSAATPLTTSLPYSWMSKGRRAFCSSSTGPSRSCHSLTRRESCDSWAYLQGGGQRGTGARVVVGVPRARPSKARGGGGGGGGSEDAHRSTAL